MPMKVVLLVFALALPQAVFGQRALNIVVPYPPGGLIDIVARMIQPRLQQEFGHNVVVENRSGAGGTPEDFTRFVKNEITKWGPVVKRAGVVPE
jgi:tripartite-type tricarboxylate transporter receptor subunit TctC